ncbi:MAG TPA: hypothetical protein PK636_07495, partial [bacterium]|nr:hypothetical protein [bacterium]
TTRVYLGRSWDYPLSWKETIGIVPCIFRPASGLWQTSNGTRFYFGKTGDVPIPGIYGENGCLGGVFRPGGPWIIRGLTRFYWGGSGAVPVPGLYQGGGEAVLPAVFNQPDARWRLRGLTEMNYGQPGDIPVTR